MEGRGKGDMAEGWAEGVLEGVFAVFFEGVSGECDGVVGV